MKGRTFYLRFTPVRGPFTDISALGVTFFRGVEAQKGEKIGILPNRLHNMINNFVYQCTFHIFNLSYPKKHILTFNLLH